MVTRGFQDVEVDNEKDLWWFHKQISDMKAVTRPVDNHLISETTSVKEALETMRAKSTDCLLILKDGYLKF